ncbi:hypothetical protein V1638_04225 [Pseudarthrobacter sp. J64]|uniref:hypothetical protein n=1 Tax=Pseudarthrobacter sp. J64 TaxID=3116485 RepID=UPI002E80797E|nr:hypothetical protein [Pseudarthrobacter sp. J64]MEE2568603.1 hypothetical protein [Pseudarthrobacter sp. J64]
MKLKNISPLGALDVPLLRAVVDAGEVIDVRPDHARILLQQPDNFAPTDKAAKTLAADLAAAQDDTGATTPDTTDEDATAPAGDAGEEGDDQ